MTSAVTAKAYSNIALAKYWGKAGPANSPATPSISLALEELFTITSVTRAAKQDAIFINGKRASNSQGLRIAGYLDYWRSLKLISGCFEVSTSNSFPAAAGLASSASGFAALAKALSAFASKGISLTSLSRLARVGSGSAARSITGGLSSLPMGADPAARLLSAPANTPWGMAIAICSIRAKEIPSRQGMEHCRKTSPYYKAWVLQANSDHKKMLKTLKAWDIASVGQIAEANMLAMHACMSSARPPLMYWNPATVALIHAASRWRERGLSVYPTIDAGPNVAFLAPLGQLSRIGRLARKVPGVNEVIISKPGGPAHFVSP